MTRTGTEPEKTSPDSPLTIRHCRDGVAAVVRLAGDLDLSTVEAAAAAVAVAESGTHATVLLDLSALRFVDSSGVRLVLMADKRARDAGRGFTVALGHGRARRLFEVLGLATRLDVVDPSR